MSTPLHGLTVALAEGRQLEELAQMLEKEGAKALRCPMVSIMDAPDAAPVVAWLHELIAGRFDYVILMTGGSSVGTEDHAPSLVAELGELLVHGVALRPASPAPLVQGCPF